jgi:RNA polymerase sigma-70 factor (sigma-E family)
MGESFEEYVTGRGPALPRVAYLLTQDRHRAEDLLQEVLVKAHRRWWRIEAPDRYVRRAILDEYLSWRRRRSSHEAALDTLPDTAVPGDGGGDPAGPQADRDAMRAALARLPRRQRAVLVLRYYEDLDNSEIADLLGCEVATVRSLASRALAALRSSADTIHLLTGGES